MTTWNDDDNSDCHGTNYGQTTQRIEQQSWLEQNQSHLTNHSNAVHNMNFATSKISYCQHVYGWLPTILNVDIASSEPWLTILATTTYGLRGRPQAGITTLTKPEQEPWLMWRQIACLRCWHLGVLDSWGGAGKLLIVGSWGIPESCTLRRVPQSSHYSASAGVGQKHSTWDWPTHNGNHTLWMDIVECVSYPQYFW